MIYQKKVLSFVYHLDDINTAVEWLSQGTGLANFELT